MITKCNNQNCEIKESCFRFEIDSENKFNNENCNHYWNIRHQPKKQIR